MKIFALALLWPAMILSAAESSGWKIDPEPALTPGVLGEWDDWAIVNPTIVKVADNWWMFFEGSQFDNEGVHSAFGIAQSDDGHVWRKHSQNPLFRPEVNKTQSCSAPSITRWRDAFWMVYVVSEDPFHPSDAPVTTRLARSDDGLTWDDVAGARLPISSTISYPLRPCLYSQDNELHLWWIGPTSPGSDALFHSVSQDAQTWSMPDQQATNEIDSRRICCARVYPSGNSCILSYVAYDESKRSCFLVTKTSADARNWISKGPPEFWLPSHFEHPAPWIVFESAGAHVFYSVQDNENGQQLRSAYCEKQAYASP